MDGTGPDDHGDIADAQVADPVQRRDTEHVMAVGHRTADFPQPGQRAGMRGVRQGSDTPPAVVVTYCAHEDRDASGTFIVQDGMDLFGIESTAAQVD